MKENLPSLAQILIVARLIGKREFVLSRNGTKKFYNKIRQYQELSQLEKSDDVNYGSRIGKSAEILCKLAGTSQIVKIAIEILHHLLKMLFAIYNVDPVHIDDKKTTTEAFSLYSTTNKIRERILQMPQLFFVKRDLTGSMGLLRHFSTDMINTIIDELTKYRLLRQGR
ncbi:unnamed protein product, partial [Rotaria sordida]